MNPYVFVVGCPRSGTTLLQRMLDHHPELTVTNDTHFIPRAVAGLPIIDDIPLTPELVDRVVTYHRFRRLEVDASTARQLATTCTSYAQFVAALYDQVALDRGKPLAGEKTPDYVRHLPLLHRLFPDARIIHFSRDGRDVALSTREWATPTKGPGRHALWRENPIAVCALWWQRQVTIGRNALDELNGHYYEVRYEALVHDPEPVMRALSAFLTLQYSDTMLRFHEGKTRLDSGLSAKKAWLPVTRGIRNWHTELDADDLQLFELLAGDTLNELGYERTVARQESRRMQQQAQHYRNEWEQLISDRP